MGGSPLTTNGLTVEDLSARAAGCERCALGETRRSVVFGEGNLRDGLMLVGESPGEKEDETGKPFVGPAGRILNKILAEVGIKREDIYITGVVKCRPPKNRLPKKAEVNACASFLKEQIRLIRLIRPKIIVCLGPLATKTLLDPKAKITEVRGMWFDQDGIKIMPTYHPASFFHDEEKLNAIREDFRRVKETYEQVSGDA